MTRDWMRERKADSSPEEESASNRWVHRLLNTSTTRKVDNVRIF